MDNAPNHLKELLDQLYSLKSALKANAKIQKSLEATLVIVYRELNNIRNNCPHDVIHQFGAGPIMGNLYSVCTACRQEFKDGVKLD